MRRTPSARTDNERDAARRRSVAVPEERGDGRRRHGQRQAARDHAVDADDAALGIRERAARISRCESHVCYNPARVATVHEPGRHGADEAERVAGRDDEFARDEARRIAHVRGRKRLAGSSTTRAARSRSASRRTTRARPWAATRRFRPWPSPPRTTCAFVRTSPASFQTIPNPRPRPRSSSTRTVDARRPPRPRRDRRRD
jgi:hypothetical protein